MKSVTHGAGREEIEDGHCTVKGLMRKGALAFLVYGFAGSGQENLRRDGPEAFRALADEMLKPRLLGSCEA